MFLFRQFLRQLPVWQAFCEWFPRILPEHVEEGLHLQVREECYTARTGNEQQRVHIKRKIL